MGQVFSGSVHATPRSLPFACLPAVPHCLTPPQFSHHAVFALKCEHSSLQLRAGNPQHPKYFQDEVLRFQHLLLEVLLNLNALEYQVVGLAAVHSRVKETRYRKIQGRSSCPLNLCCSFSSQDDLR